jgi:hypothetical protein
VKLIADVGVEPHVGVLVVGNSPIDQEDVEASSSRNSISELPGRKSKISGG